jgi:hypothetical protein
MHWQRSLGVGTALSQLRGTRWEAGQLEAGDVVNQPDHRPVSLSGLGLIGVGAMLGLALTVPASTSPTDPVRPPQTDSAAVLDKDLPDR